MVGAGPPRAYGDKNGQEVIDSQGEAPTQVRGAELPPLSVVRPAQGLPEAVRHLPHLFPLHGPQGRDPWGNQIQLVGQR